MVGNNYQGCLAREGVPTMVIEIGYGTYYWQ